MLPKKTSWKWAVLTLVLSLALTTSFSVSCSSPKADTKLSVFAAAGAKPAIGEICMRFTEQYAIEVEVNYGGGGEVLSRMVLARSGDVYIAPEQRFMDSAVEKKAIDPGTIKSLAYMVPVIAVPRGNPKHITCLSDLAKPGVRVAITRSEATLLGKFAPEIFERAGLSEAIGKNTVTNASDPNNLLTMLTIGSIDAGIIWHFFGTSASDKIKIIWLSPEQLTGIGQMQAAVSAYSRDTRTALNLIDFLTSALSKEIFEKHGYITDAEGGEEVLEIISALEKAKERFITMVDNHKLRGETVRVAIGTLSPEQAIGKPSRQDFALLGGKEVMIEAQFKQHFGQAFTNQPQNFNGLLDDVLNLNLDTINNRAIFIATINAVCSYLGVIGKVRHCRNEEPEDCGKEIAGKLISQYGKIKIGMVGYQPAILENLVKRFSVANIQCSDLDSKNIGANKFAVTICDGSTENENLIKWCDLLLATGSTHVNNTFDDLYKETISQNKNFIMFGVTGAGIAALLRLEIICPLAR